VDFLAAAHAELSYGVPHQVVFNVACAAGTFACSCQQDFGLRALQVRAGGDMGQFCG